MAASIDPGRFEELAQPQLDVLFRMALRFTRNREDAEDLVQETMLKAYRAFERFEEGTSLRAWMLRILTNSYYNRYRRLVHERHAAERPILSEEIGRAIDRLPEGFRSVFVLTEIEGLSYREAAEALAVPIGTVMSRLHRARKLLQQDLLQGETWEQAAGDAGSKDEDGAAGEGGPQEGEVVRLRTAR